MTKEAEPARNEVHLRDDDLDVDEQGRPEAPLAGDEASTLLGFLEHHRATLAWKCSGVDAAGLRATLGTSTMTLGGLLKHLAYVEDYWFSHILHGHDQAPPWNTVDWSADNDWDWDSAASDTPDELFTLWRETVTRSRSLVTETLTTAGLAHPSRRPRKDGHRPTLRWTLLHVLEEYARHNGHADLLREGVDGGRGV